MSRIYVAGPMTGKAQYNAPAFHAAQEHLTALGHSVVTPFDTNSRVWQRTKGRVFDPAVDKCEYGDPTLNLMVAEDMIEVCNADAVAVLPGFEQSKGTTAELVVATLLGKRILDAETGLDISIGVHVRVNRYTPPTAEGQLAFPL